MPDIVCPNCGHAELDPDDGVCGRCGASARAAPSRVQQRSTGEETIRLGDGGATVLTAPSPSPSGPQLSARGNDSAAGLIGAADRMQRAARLVAAVCAVVLAFCALSLLAKGPVASPPPSGVGTLVQPGAGASQAFGSDAAAPSSIDQITGYITFLQQIDLQRIGLLTSFNQTLAAGATSSSADAPMPAASLSQSAQDLLRAFLAQKAPPECASLSNDYFHLLQDQTGAVIRASQDLATGDATDAASVRTASATLFESDAAAADSALAQLCASEQIAKPFTIGAGPAPATAEQSAPSQPPPAADGTSEPPPASGPSAPQAPAQQAEPPAPAAASGP